MAFGHLSRPGALLPLRGHREARAQGLDNPMQPVSSRDMDGKAWKILQGGKPACQDLRRHVQD